MNDNIRSVGTGRPAQVVPFMRLLASPRSALVFVSDAALPSDWPDPGDGTPEGNLGHALGWTCEVRRTSIALVNPLGEGSLRADLPELSVEWLANVRHDSSCAIFIAPSHAHREFAELTIAAAAADNTLWAATVRTGIAPDNATTAAVGRNDPCPCGSGKKFKRYHG